ncbi:MAG TPA: TIGR03790 family protein [Proteobacteria bacterium]|nr:TIGR03790 family protein [Pseudomonadota bacterium]
MLIISPAVCGALTPEEVLVVANKMAWHSCDLAEYYMKRRGIPAENLIELKAPVTEHCNRDDYEQYIASPIRAFLKKNDPEGSRFRCLVTMYGIPLRVYPPKLTSEDQKRLSGLQKQQDVIREQISKAEREQNKKELTALKDAETQLKKQIDRARKTLQGAAVDSELALVREDHYSLDGWLPNKYFLGYRGQKIDNMPQNVLVVSRLDGPSEEIVRRIIDDSLETEREGLRGTAYFDARWPDPGDKKLTGYAFYDRAIHNAARVVEKSKRMPVVADSQAKLFQPGQCPNTAFYCGWYSLAHYVDAFTWARGAVGFHIASSECTTLKNKGSQVWCKVMLEKGVAATLGPVAEPYVQAFPPPDLFFALLIDGRLTLAECYALSNPFWSWQMVLIGDPLYRPFKMDVSAN